MESNKKLGIDNLKTILRPMLATVETVVNIDRDRDSKVSVNEGLQAVSIVGLSLVPAFPFFDEAKSEIIDLDPQEFEALVDWAEQEFKVADRPKLNAIVKRTLNFIKYNHNYVTFMAGVLRKQPTAGAVAF